MLCSILAGCGSGSTSSDSSVLLGDTEQSESVISNDGPEGDSGFDLAGVRYPLDSALGDIWGARGSHYQIDFTLTDGNFSLETQVLDGQSHQVLVPAMAGAVVYAKMYSVGNSFNFGAYGFVPLSSSADIPDGVGYFTNAYVGVDANQDGRVSDDEQFAVADGVVQFSGNLPDISLTFSMALANGQNVAGSYTGLFDFTER